MVANTSESEERPICHHDEPTLHRPTAGAKPPAPAASGKDRGIRLVAKEKCHTSRSLLRLLNSAARAAVGLATPDIDTSAVRDRRTGDSVHLFQFLLLTFEYPLVAIGN